VLRGWRQVKRAKVRFDGKKMAHRVALAYTRTPPPDGLA
jgi:hypothetical protein